MPFIVKIKDKNIFWTADENSVWSDEFSEAFTYNTLSDAKLAIGSEIPEYYPLEAIDSKKVVVEQQVAE